MDDMSCPYCGEDQEVCHDDGHGYAEDEKHEHHCGNCDKLFVFTTAIVMYYEPEKADCLNNGQHIWKPTCTWPIEYTKGECETCGLTRKATPEDMAAAIADREELKKRVAAK